MRFLLRPVCRVLLGLVVTLALGRSAWGDMLSGPLPYCGEKTSNAANKAASSPFGSIWWGTPVRSSQSGSTTINGGTICLESPTDTGEKSTNATASSAFGRIGLGSSTVCGPQPIPIKVNSGGTVCLTATSPGYDMTESEWCCQSGLAALSAGVGNSFDFETGGTVIQGGTLILNVSPLSSLMINPLVLSNSSGSTQNLTAAVGSGNLALAGPISSSGTLALGSSGVWETGDSLTVGAGATFIFDPESTGLAASATISSVPESRAVASQITIAAMPSAATISPVPEPSTVVLLMIAAGSVYCWRRRRR